MRERNSQHQSRRTSMDRQIIAPSIIEKYGGPVPRYTSYPTAPQFHDGVGPEAYARWLEAIKPKDERLSVYLHIPFCRELCTYCGCNTKITHRDRPIAEYVQVLEQEIDLVGEHLAGRPAVSHLHFGGGTPNILTPRQFTSLMERLGRHLKLDGETETALELDPRNLTDGLVRAMADTGVSRVSIGVQDLDPDVQRVINRIQPLNVLERAMDMLRAAGIEKINLDLMYGLPLQNVEKARHTAIQAARLGASRVALFGYAHVPWMKKHQRLLDAYPRGDGADRHAQAEAAAEILVACGYQRIGLDHFARPDDALARAAGTPGELKRNFQGYTTDGAERLLALGASAIGQFPEGFVQNAPDARGYARMVGGGTLPVVKGLEIDEDDRRRAGIIERLMCDLAVDLECFGGAQAYGPELAGLQNLEKDGLVAVDGARVTIPEEARPLMRVVAATFDRYLARSEARHSRAV